MPGEISVLSDKIPTQPLTATQEETGTEAHAAQHGNKERGPVEGPFRAFRVFRSWKTGRSKKHPSGTTKHAKGAKKILTLRSVPMVTPAGSNQKAIAQVLSNRKNHKIDGLQDIGCTPPFEGAAGLLVGSRHP